MSRYRKVDPRVWNDEKFRELSDAGKLVFFMLLTHPNMTALGAMRATTAGLAEELGWETEAFRDAFADVLAKGMAEHDAKACLIALPRFIKYNQPESPNVVKAWVGALDLLPECDLKSTVLHRAKQYAEDMTEGYAKAFQEAFAKTILNQEQKPKQKPKSPRKAPQGAKTSLREWLDSVKAKGEQPIPEGDPIFGYAEKIELPKQFLRLAWREFVHQYTLPRAKQYVDWREHFRNAVRRNWFKLWWLDGDKYVLTTAGVQAQRVEELREAAVA